MPFSMIPFGVISLSVMHFTFEAFLRDAWCFIGLCLFAWNLFVWCLFDSKIFSLPTIQRKLWDMEGCNRSLSTGVDSGTFTCIEGRVSRWPPSEMLLDRCTHKIVGYLLLWKYSSFIFGSANSESFLPFTMAVFYQLWLGTFKILLSVDSLLTDTYSCSLPFFNPSGWLSVRRIFL